MVLAVVLLVLAAGCGLGGGDDAGEPMQVWPTPTPQRPTLGGSPLDAVDDPNAASNSAAGATQSDTGEHNGSDTSGVERSAVDCSIHAQNPDTDCEPSTNSIELVRFNESFWSFEHPDGYTVYTNIEEPYPIEDVVSATVDVARAELAGHNQALFPHLSNRRSTAPYVDLGVWSVTFLFAKNPADDPARVQVAIEGTTPDGDVFEELVTYHWQWTPQRWIPEWETLLADTPTIITAPKTDGSDGDGDGDDAGAEGQGVPGVEGEPPPGAIAGCPAAFPYAHSNGKCYANPINPTDQVAGPASQQLEIVPGAPFIPQNDN